MAAPVDLVVLEETEATVVIATVLPRVQEVPAVPEVPEVPEVSRAVAQVHPAGDRHLLRLEGATTVLDATTESSPLAAKTVVECPVQVVPAEGHLAAVVTDTPIPLRWLICHRDRDNEFPAVLRPNDEQYRLLPTHPFFQVLVQADSILDRDASYEVFLAVLSCPRQDSHLCDVPL
jgi:hypothetical protein